MKEVGEISFDTTMTQWSTLCRFFINELNQMVQIFEIFSGLNWVNGSIEILSFNKSIVESFDFYSVISWRDTFKI